MRKKPARSFAATSATSFYITVNVVLVVVVAGTFLQSTRRHKYSLHFAQIQVAFLWLDNRIIILNYDEGAAEYSELI